MKSDYLIVHKKLLPPYLEKVIEARELLNSHKVDSISQAVKKVGISRNTYYKYKDFVFKEKSENSRHAVLSLVLKDSQGALSSVISCLSHKATNIVTISQAVPLSGLASVLITIDISQMSDSLDELISDLKKLPATRKVDLSAIE
jgi:chorismate mutase